MSAEHDEEQAPAALLQSSSDGWERFGPGKCLLKDAQLPEETFLDASRCAEM